MRVYLNIDPSAKDPSKPGEAFVSGLEACGYRVCVDPARCDMLITWTPWPDTDRYVLERQFVAAGRSVIYVENGWLTPIQDRNYFQIAFGGWNGSGIFPEWNGADRWDSWNVELLPWKETFRHEGAPGETVMVAPQRTKPPGGGKSDGKGGDHRAQPLWWEEVICGYLDARKISYSVRLRESKVPLEEALDKSWCVMTWNSTLAMKAVIRGIPVRYFGPNIMAPTLCTRGLQTIKLRDRLPVLRKLAGAQFTAGEIAEGWPLRRLIESRDPGLLASRSDRSSRRRKRGFPWFGMTRRKDGHDAAEQTDAD